MNQCTYKSERIFWRYYAFDHFYYLLWSLWISLNVLFGTDSAAVRSILLWWTWLAYCRDQRVEWITWLLSLWWKVKHMRAEREHVRWRQMEGHMNECLTGRMKVVKKNKNNRCSVIWWVDGWMDKCMDEWRRGRRRRKNTNTHEPVSLWRPLTSRWCRSARSEASRGAEEKH